MGGGLQRGRGAPGTTPGAVHAPPVRAGRGLRGPSSPRVTDGGQAAVGAAAAAESARPLLSPETLRQEQRTAFTTGMNLKRRRDSWGHQVRRGDPSSLKCPEQAGSSGGERAGGVVGLPEGARPLLWAHRDVLERRADTGNALKAMNCILKWSVLCVILHKREKLHLEGGGNMDD